MKNKFIHLLIPALALIVVIIGASEYMLRKDPSSNEPSWTTIDSFEECARLYPVMESYPEQCRTPGGVLFVRDISADLKDLIVVDSPKANDVVSSPLVVTGKARGNWFFEASFPVTLIDANGNILGQIPAQALTDWMTTEFVPFKVTLTFKKPLTVTGTLIVHNDNPSGDPTRDKEVRIPVRFVSKPAPKSAQFGVPVVLGMGEDVTFPDGLHVVVKEINDSRCKPDVECIWAGEISVLMTRANFGEEGRVLEEFRLGTVNNKSIARGAHVLALKEATAGTATIVVTSIAPVAGDEAFIAGYVHIGPICPVEKNPPDPSCADKPFSGALVSIKSGDKEVAKTTTDANGNFKILLPVDSYVISVKPANGAILPSCADGVVQATGILNADISCDSGIR